MKRTIIAIILICMLIGIAYAEERTVKAQDHTEPQLLGTQVEASLNGSNSTNRTVKAMLEDKINATKTVVIAKGEEMIDKGKNEAKARLDNLSDSLKKEASVRIEDISGQMKIKARDKIIDVVAKTFNDKTILTVNGHNVTVYGEVQFRNQSMVMNGREIKVMPDTAKEIAIEKLELRNITVLLKDTGVPTYEVNGGRKTKILGLFGTDMEVSLDIDAETGKVLKENKPWWAFLAS